MAKEKCDSDSLQKRSGLLKNQVHLLKKKNSERFEIEPIQNPLSFDKGFFIFVRACQLLAQNNDGVVFVGIAGPSGAGKTIFTEKVMTVMPGNAVLSMDNYNDASRLIDGNFDDPRLTDYDTLLENLNGLKMGETVHVPIYDFKTSSRSGYRMVEAPSSRIVIIEGIYALSEKLRPFLDLRVSITGGIHFDLVKRVLRDIQRAGQEPEEIIHQISETVYPMYKAFIEPDLKTAHIKIVNKFNPFAGFQSPTYILKSTRSLSVEQIKAVMPKDVSEKTEEIFDIYLLPPGEDPESCQSYLRMRNRDGIYNLMFEEWVTDNPFIISPRISFEVGVRLLGGLMTLGYTIAAILKRRSTVLSDDKVTVKIDQLAQLNRNYIQVQGKDRASVKKVATELGLDGSYTARTYIEQIQLENLVNEIMTVPDDLKMKLRKYDESISSPTDILCTSFTEKNCIQKGMSRSYTVRGENHLSRFINSRDKISAGQGLESYDTRNEFMNELRENIVTLAEKMTEFASHAEEANSKLHYSLLTENCISKLPSPKESVNIEEQIMILAKGQYQIIQKLETLSRNVIEVGTLKETSSRNHSRKFLNAGDLGSREIISIAAIGVCGILLWKLCRK